MNKLKIVKFIVFLLTFLLVFGTLSAFFIVYKKASSKTLLSTDLSLNQPKGSYIENYLFNNDRLYILVKGGGLADRILVVDPEHQQINASVKTF